MEPCPVPVSVAVKTPLSKTPAVSQRRIGRLNCGKVCSLRRSAVCSMRSKHFAMSASKQYLGCVLIALKMAPMASCTDRPGRKP